MKNLLLTLAVLCSAGLSAQLYVAPNGTTDSYVYVTDEVLYVEQDVNLVRNNAGATNASIYLRNDGQLIQGDAGVSTNSGTGFLSAYQNSRSDSYDYNYWSSPVGANYGSGNTNFGRPRLYEATSDTDASQSVFSGGDNGVASPLAISGRWFYKYNEATQRFAKIGSGHSVVTGYGFIMKGTEVTTTGMGTTVDRDINNQNYDFRGRPHNGDITVALQTGVTNKVGNLDNFTLSGNPYPSALDLNEVFFDPTNVGMINSIAYWDEDRSVNSHFYIDNKGGYGSWIPVVEDNTNPGLYTRPTFTRFASDGTPTTPTGTMGENVSQRRFAPIAQGFMIVANATGSITFKNEHREFVAEGAAGNSIFKITGDDPTTNTTTALRGSSTNSTNELTSDDGSVITAEPAPSLNPLPHIRIFTSFGDTVTHFRDMVLVFHENATDDYDYAMDADHPMDAALGEAYFPLRYHGTNDEQTDRDLVIQSVPFTDVRKMVPIAFTLDLQTKFKVQVVESNNLPFEDAYLYDNSDHTYRKITNGGDATLLLPEGVYEERFFITFRAPKGSQLVGGEVNEELEARRSALVKNVKFVQNNPAALLEVSNPEGYDVREVNIYDMTGKLVVSQGELGTQNRLSFPTGNLSDGIYLVKLTTADNLTTDYRINVFNK